jgi:4-diphosphocytidyl-2-C-methyl-D-erythritol kinase
VTRLAYRCFAKINLTLEVLGRREDGYHDLASLVHTIDLADDLRLSSAEALCSRVDGLVLNEDTNLVTRAARLLAAAAGVPPGACLNLLKWIPAAAGLGGGSSDAAATLVGLNRLWDTRLRASELARLASKLGSDVPFFVDGGAALMRGRGDQLQALPPLVDQWLVLVVPAHDVPDKTARLYAALEASDFSDGEATDRLVARLEANQPLRPDDLCNGFERAARGVFPELTSIWTAVERACGRKFCLSGAGPALFALAHDRADAVEQQARLARDGFAAFATVTVPSARARLAHDFASRPPVEYA